MQQNTTGEQSVSCRQRAEVERQINDQQEVQRQSNDCLAYKVGKQSEDQLAKRIDEVNTNVGEVW